MGGRTGSRAAAAGRSRRGAPRAEAERGPAWRADVAALRPMLAVAAEESAHDRLLGRGDLVFERKYDGIRVLIEVSPGAGRRGGSGAQEEPHVRIWSRLGNDKTAQFPEVAGGLAALAPRLAGPIVLDGEIVAVDAAGGPLPFQHLQGRMHRRGRPRAAAPPTDAVLVAFDLLRDGDEDLRPRPFTERRARLVERVDPEARGAVRLVPSQHGGGADLHGEALAGDWEGLIVKDPASRYLSGRRHPAWRKLKFVRRQEFVVGGWTEGRSSRKGFGALLVGYYPGGTPAARPARGRTAAAGASAAGRRRGSDGPDRLIYAGHVGSGFSEADLDAIGAHLRAIASDESPFSAVPPANEPAHWVDPSLVVEVKFTQWTTDDVLRHPVYLGVRADAAPRDVRREDDRRRRAPEPAETPAAGPARPRRSRAGESRRMSPSAPPSPPAPAPPADPALDALCEQLRALEASRKRGVLALPDGSRVPVGNLHKVFWPDPGLTKGDLVRFNLRMSPYLLPVVADRPLVMKRFPNGIDGKSFYQHRSPDEMPDGIRVVTVRESPGREDSGVPYLIGGTLQTLTWMAQLAVISQDPWFSRLPDIEQADVVALDLDPMPEAPFSRVVEVARWLHDELARLGAPCMAKTSGASGLHIYIPLAPGTPYEAGLILCQILATIVASRHPRAATVERMVKRRAADAVYIDYLQNIYGKTLAAAYSARASPFAGVSTPLTWDEVHDGLRTGMSPQDFTLRNIFDRLDEVGDLWAGLRTGDPADLRAVLAGLEAR